jgi:hypothetical protein
MSIPSSQRSTTQISARILTGISTQRCLCHLYMPSTAFCCSTCHGSLVRLSSGVPAWHMPLHLSVPKGRYPLAPRDPTPSCSQ